MAGAAEHTSNSGRYAALISNVQYRAGNCCMGRTRKGVVSRGGQFLVPRVTRNGFIHVFIGGVPVMLVGVGERPILVGVAI